MEFYLNLNFYNIMNKIKEKNRKTKGRRGKEAGAHAHSEA